MHHVRGCVESCKFGAITKVEEESENDLSAYKDVWVFAEQRAGVITPVVFELLGKDMIWRLDIRGCQTLRYPPGGDELEDMTRQLFEAGAEVVYIRPGSSLLANYTADGYTKVISDAIHEFKPEIVCMGRPILGRIWRPVEWRPGSTQG